MIVPYGNRLFKKRNFDFLLVFRPQSSVGADTPLVLPEQAFGISDSLVPGRTRKSRNSGFARVSKEGISFHKGSDNLVDRPYAFLHCGFKETKQLFGQLKLDLDGDLYSLTLSRKSFGLQYIA